MPWRLYVPLKDPYLKRVIEILLYEFSMHQSQVHVMHKLVPSQTLGSAAQLHHPDNHFKVTMSNLEFAKGHLEFHAK